MKYKFGLSQKAQQMIAKIKNLIKRWKQYTCSQHVTLTSEIRRRPDGLVESNCLKCGKLLVAEYGLILPGRLISKRDQL